MITTPRRYRGIALAALLLAAPALRAAPAAEINLATGSSTVSRDDGEVRALKKGDPVYAGDTISSGATAYVNLKFADGSFVLIRPRSRFFIEAYRMQGAAPATPPPARAAGPATTAATPVPIEANPSDSEPPRAQALFRLLRGGFRAVSGVIGRLDHSEYRVATPIATIGIRGTDYGATICDEACAADPVIRGELTDDDLAEGGLVTGVDSGGIDVTSAGVNCDDATKVGGICPVDRDQSLLVDRNGSQHRLPAVPEFLRADPFPDPRTCGS